MKLIPHWDVVLLIVLVVVLASVVDSYDLWPGFRVAGTLLATLTAVVEVAARAIENNYKKTVTASIPSNEQLNHSGTQIYLADNV